MILKYVQNLFYNRLEIIVVCHSGIKKLLPSIAILGPEAIAISSPMTPHIPEIKESLKSFIAEEFLPEFYFIKDPSSYMLSGITQLCMDYLDYK